MEPLLFGSACSGIGGLDLGLEDAGLRCAWQIEISPACTNVLRYHWPDVPKHYDLREVNPVDLAPVRCVAGGTPCQDLSVAGSRAGLDGEQSGLFHDFVRLADSQPAAWVLWENVDGALSSPSGAKGEDFAVVLRKLTGFYPSVPVGGWRSAGFCVGPKRWAVWRVLDSEYFGVAQRRNRLFVVAGPRDRPCPEVLLEPGCLPGNPPPSREAGPGVASLLAGSAGRGWRIGADEAAGGQIVRGGSLIIDGQNAAVIRGDLCGTLQAANAGSNRSFFVAHPLTTRPYADGGTNEAGLVPTVAYALNAGCAGRLDGESETFIPVVTGSKPGDPAPALNADPRLAVYQCQGSNVGPMGALRAGNGHLTGGVPFVANTLAGNSGRHQIEQTYLPAPCGVRRLTPREYERLQGYPDDWTRYGVDERGLTVELKDAPRYRGCGNGVTRNVAEWIGRRLVAALAPALPAEEREREEVA